MTRDAAPAATIDPRELRNACGLFGTGVTVITTRSGGHDHGMTANAFMSVSLDPALVAISIDRRAKMLPMIRAAGRFAVSVLADGDEATAWHFAGRPAEGFAPAFAALDGMPVIAGAAAVFATTDAQAVEAGDHVIFLGRVTALDARPDRPPLIFHKGRFGRMEPEAPAPASLLELVEEVIW